jgi:hypothetical protein
MSKIETSLNPKFSTDSQSDFELEGDIDMAEA